jgi:alanine or glycine:cation symporter, AGCS family
MDKIDAIFQHMVEVLAPIVFWEPIKGFLPLILIVLVFGGVFFTLRYSFINVRLLRHCFNILRGHYDNPNDQGQITHFQALTSALSGTVGLGNIAGVAIAIGLGGPGAVFWLWVTAFFGMCTKFSSCTLGLLYRRIGKDGRVLGGPMVYLEEGLKKKFPQAKWLGKLFGVFFASMTCIGALVAVSLFQANQTFELISGVVPSLSKHPLLIGSILSLVSAIVIIGGIKRIADTTSRLVPAMCIFYTVVCLIIILSNYAKIPHLFGEIFRQAINPKALFGGFIPVMIQGIRRAAFSNEAGLGSSSIAHSAAKTKEPVREGIVAMIGPFIDTHIVCTMTALTILITGVHLDPALQGKGASMTAAAFATLHPVFPYLLTLASIVFAFSTIITWSYYGQKASEYLFGSKSILPFRLTYVLIIAFAPFLNLLSLITFADILLLCMAFPNVIGMLFLSKEVKLLTNDYLYRLKSGQMTRYVNPKPILQRIFVANK